jgi:hypothetical protein
MFLKPTLKLIAIFSFIVTPICVRAQDSPKPPTNISSNPALMAQLVALRDSFVSQLKREGFQPSLPPPTIILDNPPSFGNYEDGKNLLHIADWSALSADDQARFERVAAMLDQGQTGEQAFDDGVHHWVFIHEMGHWWQACEHKTTGTHYAEEYGANRIAAAYWRLNDPSFMERTKHKMTVVIPFLPNPVPEAESKEKYFNANYETLARTRGYIWYQYDMVLNVESEKPLPSFQQALQQPSYP